MKVWNETFEAKTNIPNILLIHSSSKKNIKYETKSNIINKIGNDKLIDSRWEREHT
jgi:hypothetical protein